MEELISALVGEGVSRVFDWASAGITEKGSSIKLRS